jgi:hypothetical protein
VILPGQDLRGESAPTPKGTTLLDTLTSELVAVVQQTMQPTQTSIWLR